MLILHVDTVRHVTRDLESILRSSCNSTGHGQV